jgi:hypothetical protein
VQTIFVLIAVLLSFIGAVDGYAFHEGTANECSGCHIINSDGSMSLKGSDPSSTCLPCHSRRDAYSVKSSDGSSFRPAGDFYWLSKTYKWTDEFNSVMTSSGSSHGHNIIAFDYGLFADERLTRAPGGNYPSGSLGCSSCHDPHAIKSSSYRLLGGIGYDAGGYSGFSFKNTSPIAVAPDNWTETDSNHVSYGSGFSEWCVNCHPTFINCRTDHPTHHPACIVAYLGYDIANNYRSYVRSGNLAGSKHSAYFALVPFENGSQDIAALDPSSAEGPDADSNVMCLTCHRAHASAFESIGRWDFHVTFLKDSHPDGAGDGSTYFDKNFSYYGRTFDDVQRQLCNKCHVRD